MQGFSIIDSIGNILHQIRYPYPPIDGASGVFKVSDNHYIFHGTVFDTCGGQPNDSPLGLSLDSSGNIISQVAYVLNGSCYGNVWTMGVSTDKGIISIGRARPRNYYVLYADSTLNVKWAKYYTNHVGSTVITGWGQFGKSMPDGGFLLGFNLDSSGTVIARTDSMGNNIWCKSYFRPKSEVHDCVVLHDGSSIITGYTDTSFGGALAPKLFMMKIDSSGDVLWCKGFDNSYHWMMSISSIISTSDGGYMILSNNGVHRQLLIKTDINGDTLWTRSHGIYGYNNGAYGIVQTSDKGFMYGGSSYGSFPGMNSGAEFIYKTDSLGYSTCNQYQIPVYTYDLFPTDSNVIMTSIDGATTMTSYVTAIPYSIDAYDECRILSHTAVVDPSQKNYNIQPNPTKGSVHILYHDMRFTSDCYFTVYDNIGRVLIQKVFINGNNDTLIDLGKYGKGLYLIKVTDGRNVCTDRVVVE